MQPSARRRSFALPAALVAAGAYVLAGVTAMIALSPRVPYADPWRFYARLIETPFPANVLAVDNGHRELLPSLVRLAELRLSGADQSLQIVLGVLLALATLALLLRALRDTDVTTPQRAAAALVGAIGVFWLGNERALAHANESVHAYLVTSLLLLALGLVARAPPVRIARHVALATLCALGAALSFGSGVACLPALAVVLWLRRAAWRAWLPLLAGSLVVLALQQTGAGLRIDVPAQLAILLRWLAAPFVYAFWPLLDPAIALQLPAPARAFALPLANLWVALFGDVREALWPHALVSAAGLVALARALWRARRTDAASARLVALGLAMFALGVGGLVALSRLDYFAQHAGQIVAPRYVVWSSLFWCGLALAGVLATRRPRRALAVALAVAVVLVPSSLWMARLAANTRTLAEQVALGSALGVLADDAPLGENRFDEIVPALPLLERERAAMYAWPETAWLGRAPPVSHLRALPDARWQTEAIVNRFGGDGQRVHVQMSADASTRVLLLDAEGRLAGLALCDGSGTCRGWLRGTLPPQAAAAWVD